MNQVSVCCILLQNIFKIKKSKNSPNENKNKNQAVSLLIINGYLLQNGL